MGLNLFSMWSSHIELVEKAEHFLSRVALAERSAKRASELSHGDQRLLEVAMAIAQRPRLLMLDEPTQGLSIQETDHAVGMLKAMLADGNLSVILSSTTWRWCFGSPTTSPCFTAAA